MTHPDIPTGVSEIRNAQIASHFEIAVTDALTSEYLLPIKTDLVAGVAERKLPDGSSISFIRFRSDRVGTSITQAELLESDFPMDLLNEEGKMPVNIPPDVIVLSSENGRSTFIPGDEGILRVSRRDVKEPSDPKSNSRNVPVNIRQSTFPKVVSYPN